MKYAIYQMDIVAGDPGRNREKVKNWAAETVKKEQPDILVLPEMWTTAYTLPELEKVADRNGEPTLSFLKDLAKAHHIHLIGGSVANKKDGHFYNTALMVNRKGQLVYQYDKIHLVPMLHEPEYLFGGQSRGQVFELDGIKMGIIICYDLRFPELIRRLALEGVQVLHIVAEWPSARRQHWITLQQARAIENQMYVISSNRVGTYDGEEFAGTSMVVDPWGEILVEGSTDQEETIVATVQLDKVPKVRKDVPVFSSRVPELY